MAAPALAVLRGQARLQLPAQQVDLPVDQAPLVGQLLLLLALALDERLQLDVVELVQVGKGLLGLHERRV